MNNWLSRILLAAVAIILVHGASANTTTGDAKPMAVFFHADWCTNCKILEPKYNPLTSSYDGKIQFVTLDVTDENTKAKARATAGKLDIGPLYFSNQSTGWVALLDSKHNKVGELHSDQSAEDMRAALDKLAQSS